MIGCRIMFLIHMILRFSYFPFDAAKQHLRIESDMLLGRRVKRNLTAPWRTRIRSDED